MTTATPITSNSAIAKPTAPTTKPCGCPDLERAITRRSFLKRSATAGIVAGLAADGLFTQLAFASTPYDGDVMVVLSLRGGMDGLNVIVPAADPDYATLRPNIGIPQGALIPLDATFGMHPALAPLEPLWDAGTLGIVHAVGMAEPNRSHFQAMEEMERAAPGTSLRTGWLDRVLGLRDPGTAFQGVQMGDGLPAAAFRGSSPELAMWSVDGFELDAAYNDAERARWNKALRGLHEGAPVNLASPTGVALDALDTAAQLKAAGYTPANGAAYPDGGLGDAMKDVARLIKADVGLQVAAIDYGDWDMHAGMGTPDTGWMYDHLTELSGALAAFATDLGAKLNDVTLVSLTEFGRRAEENGSGGCDHGYGQAVLMLGGGVKGGTVHGNWPGLAPDKLIDGDLNGWNDYRKVLAEVLEKRCRADAGAVADIFPSLDSGRYDTLNLRP
jgi:uncharacterized protein (DUF1501 family)